MMQKLSTYISLLVVFAAGLLLIYRSFLDSNDFIQITGRVLERKIEPVSTTKGSLRYGLTFKVDQQDDKLGIYLGTKEQAENDNIISSISEDKVYSFLIDPTVSASNGIKLGIRQINFNGKILYKKSEKNVNLVGGIFLTFLGLAGLFIIYRFKRKTNSR